MATPISEIIFSGFISKVVNNCVDISWAKIKNVAGNGTSEHQDTESQIYNVIVDVLNRWTYNRFEGDQDKIYQAAEKLLMCCKSVKCDASAAVKPGLQILEASVDNDRYIEFKELLCHELSRNSYEELYREIRLRQQCEENRKTLRIEHEINEIKSEVQEMKQAVLHCSGENGGENASVQTVKYQNDKKQDYMKIWNSRLFLHLDNDERPITLAEAFIMPDYKMNKSMQRLECFGGAALDHIIDEFIQCDETSTMLITGVPGMGKSTITSWIANRYQDNDKVIVLRFRDWDREELGNGLLNVICSVLECKRRDLKDHTIVLDGFDEMKYLDERERILGELLSDIKDFDNIKIIITSRPAYINWEHFSNYLTLLEFDIARVETFYKRIKGEELGNKEGIERNLGVLGIPVILYMAIVSNADINKELSKPELYNKIFAERGGIFDRFFDGKVEYGKGKQLLRDPDNIKKYLKFLRETAFTMFEKNKLSLAKNECNIPKLQFEGKCVSILEFPIKQLFDIVKSDIEFIHKSIYEYFAAEYIYISLSEGIDHTKEALAGTLGSLLKGGQLNGEMLGFLKFRIGSSKMNAMFDTVYGAFQLMLQDGMTYYANGPFKDIIACEMKTFTNMLEVIHLWDACHLIFNSSWRNYIDYKGKRRLNLRNIDLRNIDLSGIDLRYADLRNAIFADAVLIEADFAQANLKGANFEGANLKSACFEEADLEEASLVGAELFGINMRKANLKGAHFAGAKLEEANLREVDLRGTHLGSILWASDLTESNLEGKDLRGVELCETNLTRTNLRAANLERANLGEAYLVNTDFTEANLRNAYLPSAHLIGVNLAGINLSGADLSFAYFENVNFAEANLKDVNINGSTWDSEGLRVMLKRIKKLKFEYIFMRSLNNTRDIKIYKKSLLK